MDKTFAFIISWFSICIRHSKKRPTELLYWLMLLSRKSKMVNHFNIENKRFHETVRDREIFWSLLPNYIERTRFIYVAGLNIAQIIKLDALEAKLATNSTCYYFKQQLNTYALPGYTRTALSQTIGGLHNKDSDLSVYLINENASVFLRLKWVYFLCKHEHFSVMSAQCTTPLRRVKECPLSNPNPLTTSDCYGYTAYS